MATTLLSYKCTSVALVTTCQQWALACGQGGCMKNCTQSSPIHFIRSEPDNNNSTVDNFDCFSEDQHTLLMQCNNCKRREACSIRQACPSTYRRGGKQLHWRRRRWRMCDCWWNHSGWHSWRLDGIWASLLGETGALVVIVWGPRWAGISWAAGSCRIGIWPHNTSIATTIAIECVQTAREPTRLISLALNIAGDTTRITFLASSTNWRGIALLTEVRWWAVAVNITHLDATADLLTKTQWSRKMINWCSMLHNLAVLDLSQSYDFYSSDCGKVRQKEHGCWWSLLPNEIAVVLMSTSGR